MKRFAMLCSICLLAAGSVAHASTVNPLSNGFTITVDGLVLNNVNASFNPLTGNLAFYDQYANFFIAEASASPLVSALSFTRTCVTANLNGGCNSSTVAISNASFANGTLQASALVGATLQASATAGVSNLVFAAMTLNAGAETALVGYPASNGSGGGGGAAAVTPEPTSLALLGTGLLSMCGVARRRLTRVS